MKLNEWCHVSLFAFDEIIFGESRSHHCQERKCQVTSSCLASKKNCRQFLNHKFYLCNWIKVPGFDYFYLNYYFHNTLLTWFVQGKCTQKSNWGAIRGYVAALIPDEKLDCFGHLEFIIQTAKTIWLIILFATNWIFLLISSLTQFYLYRLDN